LSSKNFVGRLLDILETGVPITSLAETITLGGVMQGVHSIDLAVLVNPILVEYMEGVAKQAEIEYTLGDTDDYEKEPDDFILGEALRKLEEDPMIEEDDEPVAEEEVAMPKEEPMGLMARRRI